MRSNVYYPVILYYSGDNLTKLDRNWELKIRVKWFGLFLNDLNDIILTGKLVKIETIEWGKNKLSSEFELLNSKKKIASRINQLVWYFFRSFFYTFWVFDVFYWTNRIYLLILQAKNHPKVSNGSYLIVIIFFAVLILIIDIRNEIIWMTIE